MQSHKFTPLHMEIMVHAAALADPYRPIAQVPYDYMIELRELGLITVMHTGKTLADHAFKIDATPKGRAWLEKALSTPMPVEVTKWVFVHA